MPMQLYRQIMNNREIKFSPIDNAKLHPILPKDSENSLNLPKVFLTLSSKM